MQKLILFALFILVNYSSWGQELYSPSKINPDNVKIIRDKWGIPHIKGNTDAEAAYGLAWAHAEDDFRHIQENLIAGKGRLAEVIGKDGALFDFGLKFFKIREITDSLYESQVSEDYKNYLEGYAQGLNAFAEKHPKEVLLKDAFPIGPKDIISGYTLTLSLMSGIGMSLKAINDGAIKEFFAPNEKGSNAVAIHPKRTDDGKAWLLVNSHQPIEGRFAWYEAHIQSDEGLNMLGGLFPGGASIFVGSNENLGWAHTNNFHNFGDIYEMKVHPKAPNLYYYDNEWIPFKERTIRLKVKIAGIKLPVKRKILESEYGPVFEKDGKYYALRFPAYQDIRAGEQWYRMNKAKSYTEFHTALEMQALPMFNVIYADRDSNIFMISEGMIPERDPSLDWSAPITGISSKHKWNKLIPMSMKPQYFNPECGFVYNANNSPKRATCLDDYQQEEFIGLQQFHYNRGERFHRLLGEHEGAFTWEDFKRIKYDNHYDPSGSYMKKLGAIYQLDENKYPEIKDAIQLLKRWNFSGDSDNEQAAFAMIMHKELSSLTNMPFAYLMIREQDLKESEIVDAITKTKKYLLKTHGKIELPLSEVQRLVRGDVSLPLSGASDVNRAVDVSLHDEKKGIYRMKSGDGYIQMTRFSKDGVEIQAVNAYGASARPESPHYTDQMEMFVKQEMRTMYLNMNEYPKEYLKPAYSPK